MRKAPKQSATTSPTTTRVEFHDPERHRWHFFLLSREVSSSGGNLALPAAFTDALNAAWSWLGQSGEAPLRQAPLSNPYLSQRLVPEEVAKWHKGNGMLRTLEARTLADTCYLQLGVAKAGALNTSGLTTLRDAFPTVAGGKPYLGAAECWCLMLDKGEPNENALRCALQQLALPQDGYLTFATQGGRLALYPDTLTCCLVYSPAQTQPMSQLLHRLLPAFMLNLLKIRLLREQYLQFKPQVLDEEKQLEGLMARARHAHQPSIEQIEQQSVQLTQQQAHYLETLSQIEEWAHTLETTRDNLRRLLRDPLWDDGNESAPARRLLEPVQLLIDQLQSDLRYFHITRQQADLHLQSLTTTSEVRIAQWNRRITLLLGIFVVLELPQAFPELPIPARVALIVAGALVLIVGNWYFTRR